MNLKRSFLVTATLFLLLASAPFVPAQSTQPTTSPAAQAVLDQIRDAYARIKTLELAGTFSLDADVAGQQSHQSANFNAWFQAPGKFRHEAKDEATIVGTGEKIFSYLAPRNQYMTADQPHDRTADLPAGAGELLHEQNPSLALALCADAGAELAADTTSIEKVADVQIDGKNYSAIKLVQPDRDFIVAIDPQTSLLRQMRVDLRKLFEQQQVPQIKHADVMIDYTTIKTDAAPDAAKFAFAPPQGATLIDEKAALAAAANAANAPGQDAAQQLVGKQAPPIKLENLDGKTISPLIDNKGSVIVIDFWATWCGPCRESLPHLNELYKNKQADGVHIYAVDLQEDADTVQKFVESTKLSVPVLLDAKGAVASGYLVNGIPQTIVVGKDGNVRSVFVGFGADSPEKLTQAVDEALKAK